MLWNVVVDVLGAEVVPEALDERLEGDTEGASEVIPPELSGWAGTVSVTVCDSLPSVVVPSRYLE